MNPILVISAVVAVAFLVRWLWRSRSNREEPRVVAALPTGTPDLGSLYAVVENLVEAFDRSPDPRVLLDEPRFHDGVNLLNGNGYSDADLMKFYRGDNAIIACLALETMVQRGEITEVPVGTGILDVVSTMPHWTRYFALRAADQCTPADQPLMGFFLSRMERWDDRFSEEFARDFFRARLEKGETPTFAGALESLSEPQLKNVTRALEHFGEAVPEALRQEFEEWSRSRIDLDALSAVGRVHDGREGTRDGNVIETPAIERNVGRILQLFDRTPPRSVLMVGESGVGKSATVRALTARLLADGWLVFEAGYTEMMAGTAFRGELEGRVRDLVQQLSGKPKAVWVIPEFHLLQWAGRHEQSPVSVLDLVFPAIRSGDLRVLGEVRADAYERLVIQKPQIQSGFESVRVEAASASQTLDIARQWAAGQPVAGADTLASPEVLSEAWNLAQQFLGQAAPGNLLELLDFSHKQLLGAAAETERSMTVDDLYASLTTLTGLPRSVLDDREQLNLGGLRDLFARRVLGQNEAVTCLVERVAMIKAGMTDPTRPLGVFLFAGPTGTGKTEIAKTLSEFLFGSSKRMIRLDMSELQTPESISRLVGDGHGETEGALVHQIRKQPFSVVLLDEFEKAHPNVWDLFLQVFDDGRLTDRQGNVADFRHAIIILTSNLGGVIPSGTSLGFTGGSDGFSPGAVERAVGQAFRKEFLNRIDRIVVFRPFSREIMRSILQKEIAATERRRGLRNRDWAVEWDESAVDFLLDRGFTPDLGARPLKRVIERYFLSPLALTIVDHRVPEGDQFLFVRAAGDRLQVEFVDPNVADTAAGGAVDVETEIARTGDVEVRSIALDPQGTPEEVGRLQPAFTALQERIQGAEWQESKDTALRMMAAPDFWDSDDRFAILAEAEYRDRIESGLELAGSLMGRLATEGRDHAPRDLVRRLAERLYLLDRACRSLTGSEPRDAFLLIEAGSGVGEGSAEGNRFAGRLRAMYEAWASRRGMRWTVLDEGPPRGPYRMLAAVSGFGAYQILASETGLHVWESPGTRDGSFNRAQVRIRALGQGDEGARNDRDLQAQAHRALQDDEDRRTVVRRYRSEPSPLVRDGVGGWRTGNLERVLGGDFDLMG